MATSQCKGSVSVRASIFKLLSLAAPVSLAANTCISDTPGELCLCNSFGFSVIGEGLFWTAREHHLVLATSNVGPEKTDQIPPSLDRWNFHGDLLRIHPSWSWGWRVGAGYTSPCSYWDLFAYWTAYSTDGRKEAGVFDLPALRVWGYPDREDGAKVDGAKGKWDLKTHLFEVELGRAFWIGKALIFRPFFGGQGGWIDQCLDLNYSPLDANITLKSDFSGGGLKMGFDLHFTHGTGFGVYGKGAVALLYGMFDTEFCESTLAKSKDHFHMGVPGIQGKMGFNWNRNLCCDRYRLGAFAGWEFQYWSEVNRFPHFWGQLHRGLFREENTSLLLMGLSLGGHFDF
jgi:hypothetical protein